MIDEITQPEPDFFAADRTLTLRLLEFQGSMSALATALREGDPIKTEISVEQIAAQWHRACGSLRNLEDVAAIVAARTRNGRVAMRTTARALRDLAVRAQPTAPRGSHLHAVLSNLAAELAAPANASASTDARTSASTAPAPTDPQGAP